MVGRFPRDESSARTHFGGVWGCRVRALRAKDKGAKLIAGSGVGSVLIQIAKHVIGVRRVIGIAGGAKKCEW